MTAGSVQADIPAAIALVPPSCTGAIVRQTEIAREGRAAGLRKGTTGTTGASRDETGIEPQEDLAHHHLANTAVIGTETTVAAEKLSHKWIYPSLSLRYEHQLLAMCTIFMNSEHLASLFGTQEAWYLSTNNKGPPMGRDNGSSTSPTQVSFPALPVESPLPVITNTKNKLLPSPFSTGANCQDCIVIQPANDPFP